VYTNCCHTVSGVMVHFCFNQNLASTTNGTVACP
jgi:hypothetical protein